MSLRKKAALTAGGALLAVNTALAQGGVVPADAETAIANAEATWARVVGVIFAIIGTVLAIRFLKKLRA